MKVQNLKRKKKRSTSEMASHIKESPRNGRLPNTSSAIRAIIAKLRRVRGLFTLHNQKPNLIPHHLTNKDDQWTSSADDPYFIVDLASLAHGVGWHSIKLYGACERVLSDAVLYMDYGDGFSEKDACRLAHFRLGNECLVNFSRPIKQLRFDPVRGKGVFHFSALGLRPVTKAEAIARYVRLYVSVQSAQGLTPWQAVVKKVRELGGLKALTPRNVLGYARSYEITRLDTVTDVVISDYQSWIKQFEAPYFSKMYGYSSLGELRRHLVVSLGGLNPSIDSFTQIQIVDLDCYASIQSVLSELESRGSAPEDSRCEYVTIVCQGAQLSESYFDAVDLYLGKTPNKKIDLIYTDHDHINNEGHRSRPFFKPDWSPEFQKCSSYIGPVFTVSKDYLAQLCADGNGALQLKCLPHLMAESGLINVLHIPEIQYHSAERVETLRPPNAREISCYSHCYTPEQGLLLPKLPEDLPSVSIIIPTKNAVALLTACIESIYTKSTYQRFEIILIDNGSDEPGALEYLDAIQLKDRVKVIRAPGEFNYSALNNQAVDVAVGDVLILLNNDIKVISPDWIEQLVRYAWQSDIACVGAKLLYPDDRIQHAGVILGVHGVGTHAHRLISRHDHGNYGRLAYPQEMTAVTGACLAIRKSVYMELGGLNARDLKVAFNDVDLCLKAWEKGYRNIWTPLAELYHFESVSRGKDNSPAKLTRLAKEAAYILQRWGEIISNDPAYNPNFSLTGDAFELSTRYVARPLGEGTLSVDPTKDPYYHSPNIQRVNSVLGLAGREVRGHKTLSRKPGLSVVILTLEKYELIAPLLYSLVAAKSELMTKGLELEIIVGDTGSRSTQVLQLYQELSDDIVLVSGLRYHFSTCNNDLFKNHVGKETVLFLNNDIIFENAAESLSILYNELHCSDDYGVVGAYMIYPTGKLQHGGIDIHTYGPKRGACYHPGHNACFSPLPLGVLKAYPAVTGACLMMSSELFQACDFFDESYAAEAQDVDLCLKAKRLGLKSAVAYAGVITHFENGTRNKGEFNQKDRSKFIRKWRLYLEMLNGS